MAIAIPDTTLCCIDCSAYELAARALRRSLDECRFENAVFLTDRDMEVAGVEVRRIPSITNVTDYSQFVLRELRRHVPTKFVLLIQWDGYILDGTAWRPEFQDYDYIGARWPHVPGTDVGNGGFSLRSSRLLEACADDRFVIGHPEDAAICIVNRQLLEGERGIRFAPPALADMFSFERYRGPGPHFGFHGLFNVPSFLPDGELQDFLAILPPRIAGSVEFLEVLLTYLSTGRRTQARIAWNWATGVRPEPEMAAFLRDRITPASAYDRIIGELTDRD